MIVADTNLVAYLLIPGANSALAEEVLNRDAEWATPLLCRSELRSALTLYMRHQGMSLMQAQQTMDKAERLLLRHEFAVPSTGWCAFSLHSQRPAVPFAWTAGGFRHPL